MQQDVFLFCSYSVTELAFLIDTTLDAPWTQYSRQTGLTSVNDPPQREPDLIKCAYSVAS